MQKRNRLKNLILFILFVAMVPLTALAWLSYLDTSSVPEDSIFALLYQRVTYGVSGFEIKTGNNPAAMPTRIAIKNEGITNGAQYHEASVSVLYEAMYQTIGKALAKQGEFQSTDLDDLKQSLKLDGIYFGYEGSLPISLLSNWMGQTSKDEIATDIIWLDENGILYIHTMNGFKKKSTGIKKWDIDVSKLPMNECIFAADDDMFQKIRPDTLIFENDIVQAEKYSASIPDFLDAQNGTSLTNLLSAFSYDLDVNRYEENQGQTMVFVEDYSTIHISKDGTVIFNAYANEGGIDVSSDPEYANELTVQMDLAITLVREVQNSMGDTSQAMLYAITQNDEEKVFTFIQCIGGVPVKTETPFAQLVIQNNKLMEARFQLKSFNQTGIQTPVIPTRQAAAASNNELFRLMLVYTEDEQMNFTAQCVYRF